MGTGVIIEAEDQISKAVYNHKMNLADAAAVIEGIAVPFDGQLAVPQTDGAILKDHRLYLWNAVTHHGMIRPIHRIHTKIMIVVEHFSDIMIGTARTFWGINETDLFYTTGNGSPTYTDTITGS